MRIYLNGEEAGVLDGTGSWGAELIDTTGGDLNIGTRPPDWNPFPGDIDDVALYDRALTVPEIQALYAAGVDTGEADLVGYWSFDDGTGADSGPNNLPGYFSGDPAPVSEPCRNDDYFLDDFTVNVEEVSDDYATQSVTGSGEIPMPGEYTTSGDEIFFDQNDISFDADGCAMQAGAVYGVVEGGGELYDFSDEDPTAGGALSFTDSYENRSWSTTAGAEDYCVWANAANNLSYTWGGYYWSPMSTVMVMNIDFLEEETVLSFDWQCIDSSSIGLSGSVVVDLDNDGMDDMTVSYTHLRAHET